MPPRPRWPARGSWPRPAAPSRRGRPERCLRRPRDRSRCRRLRTPLEPWRSSGRAGRIPYQSVAAAIPTATHGTGIKLGGFATQVRALELVAGDGSVVSCSPDEEPELFRAAQVGLGALGVLSTMTLQALPAFNLRVVNQPMLMDEVLSNIDEHVEGNDHFEFFWIPHTQWALTKRNNRTDEPLAPRPKWHEIRDDYLLENVAFGAVCRVGRWFP